MFITDSPNKHELLNIFSQGGTDYWRSVELGLYLPWYMITLEHSTQGRGLGSREKNDPDEDIQFFKTVLMYEIEDLLALCVQPSLTSVALRSVSVFVPGYLNQSRGWAMKKVVAIWQPEEPATHRNAGLKLNFLETACGGLYPARPADGHIEARSEGMKLVCQLPR